jgi:hypothetical protein
MTSSSSTDAVLLHLTQKLGGAFLATEHQRLAWAPTASGITPVSRLDRTLRNQVAAWEAIHLAPKGLPRVLHRVHQWLGLAHPKAAQEFWSQTGGADHLP